MRQVSGYKKILNRNQLIAKVGSLRKKKKTIVTTNGSFDILHAGHMYLLKKAKSLGDILIVGLNSDKSIKKYKDKDRPIIKQSARAALLEAIEYVDYIYIFDEVNPINFLRLVKPNIHVNSAEYGINCIEAPTVRKFNGKIVLVPKKKGLLSTTEIINKIIKVYTKK